MTSQALAALVSSASLGTFSLSTRDATLEVSPTLVQLHGEPTGEPPRSASSASWLASVLDPAEHDAVVAGLLRAAATGAARFEYAVSVDGKSRRLRCVATGQEDLDGHFILRGLVDDVSELRETEDVLQRARAEADAASHAKSRFLANMSHEIRTPMNAVLGMTRLVLDTKLAPEQYDYLRAVESSGEALLTLINGILDISKIEAGMLELDRGMFRPSDVIHDVAMRLAVRAHEKGVEVVVDVHPSATVELDGDCGRFAQVMTNIIGNAIKFTYAGEVVVRARVDGALLVIEVQDSGIGIPEEHQATIFQAFRQVSAETTREFGGTGLGLCIARELVELMDGMIAVRSVLDEGSTFEIRLPLADVVATPTALPASTRLRLGLFVHTPTLADVLTRAALAEGHDVTRFTSAADVFRAVLDTPADGTPIELVLEQDLPGAITGIELARRLRDLPGVSSMSLLTRLSARFTDDDLASAGVTRTMRKPLRPSQLLERMRHHRAETVAAADAKHAEIEDVVVALVRPKSVPPAPKPGFSLAPVASAVAAPWPRVLLAEDDPINAKLACALLRKLELDPIHVPNGQAAVDALANESFAAVLMDLQMPVLDGLEATMKIREAEEVTGRHTPIIALTANAMSGDRERCLAAGMDDYVSKPVTIGALRAVLPTAKRETVLPRSA